MDVSKVINDKNISEMFQRLLAYVKTPNFWVSLAILVVAIILWQVLKHIRKKNLIKLGKNYKTAQHVAFDIARIVFIFIVVIALMQLNGINVSGMVASLGIISIIVGLALQDFLKDIIMGTHILADKFFQIGDVVRYNGQEGEVIDFNIRTTKIRLVDYQEVMTISNRNISEIIVLADFFDLDIDIPYYIDAKKVHPVMEDLAGEIGKIEGVNQTMYKGTNSFNESSVTYRLRYWTSPKSTRNDIRRAANGIVQDGLAEAGIPFAYSHMEISMSPESTSK